MPRTQLMSSEWDAVEYFALYVLAGHERWHTKYTTVPSDTVYNNLHKSSDINNKLQ